MITTVKDLKKNLNENFKDSDTIYVLFFSKEEFEGNFDSEVTDDVWAKALSVVDDETADQDIQDQINQELELQFGDEEE
jgi:hypothetical protein